MPGTLANQLRASLLKPISEPVAAPSALPTPTSAETTRTIQSILELLLDSIHIDPGQPRQYFPADLRESVARSSLSAANALTQLIARAEQQQDAEALGYLRDLRHLAHSIRTVGLHYPILVAPEHDQHNQPIFRIVDGERRFWAMHLLHQTEADPTPYFRIHAITQTISRSADETERAQWAVNLCRDDVCAIDIAEAVWRIHERCIARLATNRQQYLSELGDEAATLVPREATLRLTQREVASLTGREMQRRNLYRYLAIAEHLAPNAKALARAYSISLSQLLPLIRLGASQQVEALRRLVGVSSASTKPTSSQNKGRPTTLQRSINACIHLVGVLHKMSDQHFANTDADNRRALLDELQAAADAIERLKRRVPAA
jgi:ParB-like nuclease domain